MGSEKLGFRVEDLGDYGGGRRGGSERLGYGGSGPGYGVGGPRG